MVSNNMKKILITGCGGMLGEAVYEELKNKYDVYATDIVLNEDWLGYLDVRSRGEVDSMFNDIKPDIVIHLAALTDLEYCQLNPGNSYDTNFMGAYNVALNAKKSKIPMVHISSAGIFDGRKNYYDEDDAPNPLNVYAASKFAGDLAVMDVPGSIIIRAGWMIGGGPEKDKKFVNKIIKQLRGGAKELLVVKDKLGTPTYTYDLAKMIHYLLKHKKHGIFNGSCFGGGSRYSVAKEMIKILSSRLHKNIKITVVKSDYFRNDYFSPRPYSEKLSNNKIKSINSSLVRDWRVCLKEYLNKFNWKI